MKPEPTADSPPKLQYTALPPRSRVVVEPTDSGVVVRVPVSSKLETIAAFGFAGMMVGVLSIALARSLRYSDSTRWPVDWIRGGLLVVVTLAFWIAMVVVAYQTIRRRNVPIVLTVLEGNLILITPDQPTLRHEYPLDEGLQIRARPRGLSIPLFVRRGELQIVHHRSKFVVLRNRDMREVNFIVTTLNDAIGANQSRSTLTEPS
jgi:hypothetical protein